VSCSGCHAQGFNETVDEVRDFAESNRLRFDGEELESIREIYVEIEDFAGIVEDDSESFQRSLGRAGIPIEGADPVSQVFLRFDGDVDIRRAAGDLGLNAELLDNDLRELNPVLQVLRRGSGLDVLRPPTLDRDDFEALYLESLCILLGASDNQPDPVLCAEVVE